LRFVWRQHLQLFFFSCISLDVVVVIVVVVVGAACNSAECRLLFAFPTNAAGAVNVNEASKFN